MIFPSSRDSPLSSTTRGGGAKSIKCIAILFFFALFQFRERFDFLSCREFKAKSRDEETTNPYKQHGKTTINSTSNKMTNKNMKASAGMNVQLTGWDDDDDVIHNYQTVFRTTHFFSHIPKSGGTYAAQELKNLLHATVRLPNNQTAYTIQKAQERFNQSYDGDFFLLMKNDDPLVVDLTGETDAYTPPGICNQQLKEYKDLTPYGTSTFNNGRLTIRHKCALSFSERPWNGFAQNIYTIIRDPIPHIMSQYNHCAESPGHKDTGEPDGRGVSDLNRLMPSRDEWLKAWKAIKESESTLNKEEMEAQIRSMDDRFRCYRPLDHESSYTHFYDDKPLPEGYTYPYPYSEYNDYRAKEFKQLDRILIDDLKRRFNVIGDLGQMVKSVCAIFIDLTEGKHIPPMCDCTSASRNEGDGSGTFRAPNLFLGDSDIQFGVKISHGVKHHGSSETIPSDQRAIISKLRQKDFVLYNISRTAFKEQVSEIEGKYNMNICDDWNHPKVEK